MNILTEFLFKKILEAQRVFASKEKDYIAVDKMNFACFFHQLVASIKALGYKFVVLYQRKVELNFFVNWDCRNVFLKQFLTNLNWRVGGRYCGCDDGNDKNDWQKTGD